MPPSQRTELPIPRELDDLVLACLEKDPEPAAAGRRGAVADGVRAAARCETWDQRQRAQSWWETHLPELTGPLTLTDTPIVESPLVA